MASQFQGFDIERNMRESASPEADRNILNNLGGGSIADDLLTFYNNLRNTSSLTVEAGDIGLNGYIVKPTQQFVYTTGTEITVGSNTYYVTDSDGKTTFRLSSTPGTPTVVLTPPTGQYIRKDDVVFSNISSLSLDRPRTLEEVSASEIYVNISDLTEEERFRLDTSLFLMIRSSGAVSYATNANEYLASIETSLSTYEQRRNQSIFKNKSFVASSDVNFKGVITIVDTINANDTALSANSNPGVFILNPRSGEYIRAFSSNENVWTESGANLVVSSSDIIMNGLMFTGPSGISLLSKGAAVIAEDVTPSANLDFTHYMDVNINGEDYSMCLYIEP